MKASMMSVVDLRPYDTRDNHMLLAFHAMFGISSPSSLRYWMGHFAGRLNSMRICESTTGYTFTPCVGSFISPGLDTRHKGPLAFGVSSERHRQIWGERNCICFEMVVGGIEPPSPQLTVRHSTTQPLLPTI